MPGLEPNVIFWRVTLCVLLENPEISEGYSFSWGSLVRSWNFYG